MNHHKLNECSFKLSVPVGEMHTEPTRVCSVCRTNEFGYTGSYYSTDEFWLCPDCLKRLKKLLNEENKE